MSAWSDRVWWAVALLEAALLAVLWIDLAGEQDPGESSSVQNDAARAGVPADALQEDATPTGADLSAPLPDGATGRGRRSAPAPDDQPVTLLHGRITNDRGMPLAAMLALMPPEEVSDERLVSGVASASNDGLYAIPGLAPGAYRFEVNAKDHRSETLAFEIQAGTGLCRLDVVLQRSWKLGVKVRAPDGRGFDDVIADWRAEHATPMSSVLVAIATEDHLPQRLHDLGGIPVTALGVGVWRPANAPLGGVPLPQGYMGELELPERKPMHVGLLFDHAVVASRQVAAGQEEVEFELGESTFRAQLGTVRMRLVDGSSGEPLPGVAVLARGPQRLQTSATSDARGIVVLEGIGPSRHTLTVRAAGGLQADGWEIEPEPGIEIDLGDVPLTAPVMVPFEFEGPDADAEIYVTLSTIEPPSHPALHARSTRAVRRNGTAQARLAPGRWKAQAACAGWRGDVVFDTAGLDGGAVRIPMSSTATLRVLQADDDRRLRLRLLDAVGGDVVTERWLPGRGTLELGLPPGRYRAEVETLAGEKTQQEVTVTAEGGTLDLHTDR